MATYYTYKLPECFASWRRWYECLTRKRPCADHPVAK